MFYTIEPTTLPQISLVNSVIIQPPYIQKKRKVDEYILYAIKNGVMRLKENGVSYTLIPGDILILDPEFIHEGIETTYSEYYYVHFRHAKIWKNEEEVNKDYLLSIRNYALQVSSYSYEQYQSEKLILPKYYHFSSQSNFIKFQCLLNDAIEDNITQLEYFKIKTSGKIMEAFLHLGSSYLSTEIDNGEIEAAKSYAIVQDILNYINSEYKEYLSSTIIEDKFNCNFDYINRVFKRVTGNTIFAYLNRVRIDQAKVLLLTTSMKTKEVGEIVGFSDSYYFSKVFKKNTGISPTVFGKGIKKSV